MCVCLCVISGKCLNSPPNGTPSPLCSSFPPSPPCFLSVSLLILLLLLLLPSVLLLLSLQLPAVLPQLPRPHALSSQLLLLCSSATLMKMDYRWRGRRTGAGGEGGLNVAFVLRRSFTIKALRRPLLPSSVHQAGHRVTGQSQPACLCFTNTRRNATTTGKLAVDMPRSQPAPN